MNLFSTFSSGNKILAYVTVSTLLIFVFLIVSYTLKINNRPAQQIEEIQECFNENALILHQKEFEILKTIKNNPSGTWPKIEKLLHKTDILAMIYQNDDLVFWNNQKISNEIVDLPDFAEDTVIKQGTGWFLVSKSAEQEISVYLLKQIETKYDVENSYLPAELSSEFGITPNTHLLSSNEDTQYQIMNLSGDRSIIGVNFDSGKQTKKKYLFLLFALYVLFYIILVLILNEFIDKFQKYFTNELISFLVFSFCLVLLRISDYYLGIPSLLKHSFLFIAKNNSVNGFSTIGDQILNAILLLSIAIKLFSISGKSTSGSVNASKVQNLIVVVLFGFISILINIGIYQIINNLEYHSLLGIQFNDLNGYTALIVVIIYTVSLFLFDVAFHRLVESTKGTVILLAAVISVFGVFYYIVTGQGKIVFPVTLGLIVLSLIILQFRSIKHDTGIMKFIVLVILFSISSALIINRAEFDSRDQHQVKMAELFKNPDDMELENTFKENYLKIKNDELLANKLNDSLIEDNDLENYIVLKYFKDFDQKFDIQLTVCESDDLLELQPDGLIIGCDNYFNELINSSQLISGELPLFIIDRRPDRILYLGKITLPTSLNSDKNINLYLQFFFTYVPEGLGYPELLVDNKLIELDLTGFSYSIYKDNQLDYKFGNFDYNTNYSYLGKYPDNQFFDLYQYRHYKVEFEPGHFIVLSRPLTRISEKLVTFSVLFLCFISLTFVTLVFIFRRNTYNQIILNLRNRLQILFVTTISVVIALLALITLIYFESNNESKIQEQLNEKTYSVIIELEHKLKGYSSLVEPDPVSLHDMLRKFSLVFFSDINLYDASGQLIASSRPEIFEKGLLSENVNPMAYEEVIVKNKLFYTTHESIGTASYYSSYAPFYLNSGQPAGIVNLPYFARQSEVRQSYYLMMFTFINLFVIFGIIGAFVALLISRVIAKPLLLLQQSIGNIQIDRKNERIEWYREDEIGQLIAEYNSMVDKLEQSTELLKLSERERAWREVAQQIAHEIKNPLTPMKLNVQYLEKYISTEDTEVDEKIKSISSSLITQIDTLDKVAEMFSDFAKTNAGNFEDVDLLKMIHTSVLLYQSHSKVNFTIDVEESDEQYVTPATEKDLLRVFNNLIKNAIQAIETKEKGIIKISIGKQSGFIIVQIADNGKGIKPQSKSKIFQPYFTTKSGGTGLGLAIVKNIMTEIGGEIDFESQENSGTVFTLKFKIR